MHSEELIIYLSTRSQIKVETLTKRRGCKKKKIPSITALSLQCLYVYMNLTFNRGPAFGGENMEQVGRFTASQEFCFENSMF